MVLFFITTIESAYSQTVTTFTCSKANISDSLISGGVISAQGVITNDTLHAKDDVIFDQNLDI
ncbi:MAG: hypothetical protein SGJ15_00445 [Bacteroidota bacterium]|nr:hypothetical protein [Bacteroidota bacterium]